MKSKDKTALVEHGNYLLAVLLSSFSRLSATIWIILDPSNTAFNQVFLSYLFNPLKTGLICIAHEDSGRNLKRTGHVVAQLVETLCYKPEDREFDSRFCHWNISLT
jgi:hypothetical protein